MPDKEGIHSLITELIQIRSAFPESQLLQFQSLVSAQQYWPLYRALFRYIPKGSRVLDWGCGNGHFSYFLSRSGYEAVAYSMEATNPEALAQFYSRAPFRLVQGDLADPVAIPFPDDYFAAAFSVGVLEHVRETGGEEARSLQEIYRVLQPGGVFICSHLPNRYSIIEALSALFPAKHHHSFRYTRKHIVELCRQSRLTLRTIERYGMLPRNVWERSPGFLRQTRFLASAYHLLDGFFSAVLPCLTQNYLFVAVK